jgi:two-component system nitrogen regulation response regulator GlnG
LVAELALSPLPGNVRQLEQLVRRLWIDWGDAARVELMTLLPNRRSVAAVAPARDSSAARNDAAGPSRDRRAPSEAELLTALEQSEWRPSRAARLLGVSRTSVYALIQRTPSLATAAALSLGEIRAQLERCGGDLERAAQALRVSRRGLLLRLRELELAGGQ